MLEEMAMKKMDEMDRNIQLRAEEWGYRAILLALCGWTLWNCWQSLVQGVEYSPVPGLILCIGVCTQSFSQMAIRQKMLEGDEEYREPNRLLWSVCAVILGVAVLLSFGLWLLP